MNGIHTNYNWTFLCIVVDLWSICCGWRLRYWNKYVHGNMVVDIFCGYLFDRAIFLAFILDDAISAFPLFIWRRQRYSSNSVTFDLQILNCCIRDNCE